MLMDPTNHVHHAYSRGQAGYAHGADIVIQRRIFVRATAAYCVLGWYSIRLPMEETNPKSEIKQKKIMKFIIKLET